MDTRWLIACIPALLLALAAACGDNGEAEPEATPTPEGPTAIDALADWVAQNRNVAFVGDCADAQRGVDVGKWCASEIGQRGTLRAYGMGPTFSEPTTFAIIDTGPADGPEVLLVQAGGLTEGDVPGIAWPLQEGDRVVIIGLGEGDCLNIREQPALDAEQHACMPDGTEAVVFEGPVEAEGFTWWRITGAEFSGWAADRWLRLPEAIAAALGLDQPDAQEDAAPDDEGDGDDGE
jgi:hypothetical protein